MTIPLSRVYLGLVSPPLGVYRSCHLSANMSLTVFIVKGRHLSGAIPWSRGGAYMCSWGEGVHGCVCKCTRVSLDMHDGYQRTTLDIGCPLPPPSLSGDGVSRVSPWERRSLIKLGCPWDPLPSLSPQSWDYKWAVSFFFKKNFILLIDFYWCITCS